MSEQGAFYGVGVGPGDPELLTLKAVRIIASADWVVYPCTLDKESTARNIAAAHLRPQQRELPIALPMQHLERSATELIYRAAADTIAQALSLGERVVFLCLGDPLLYGSFIYLYELLHPQHRCRVVPGITSVSIASAVSLTPLTKLHQTLLVLPAFADDKALLEALKQHDSIVIMKVGRHRHRIAELIGQAKRAQDAHLYRAGQHGGRNHYRQYRRIAHLRWLLLLLVSDHFKQDACGDQRRCR